LIRPVLLYGSETWVLSKREENQLPIFERKVLRTICGPKIENGICRRKYNHELDEEFNSPNALNVTMTSRLFYWGRIVLGINLGKIPRFFYTKEFFIGSSLSRQSYLRGGKLFFLRKSLSIPKYLCGG
jgi:hypothetical protein